MRGRDLEEKGVVRPELRVGTVFAVTPSQVKLALPIAALPSAVWLDGSRYGRGEVGELVVIEGQTVVLLGRLTEVRVPDADRERGFDHQGQPSSVMGTVQLLGSIDPSSLRVAPGVEVYPRVGDAAYACPHALMERLPELMVPPEERAGLTLELGSPRGAPETRVRVRPEKLFGRHCAVLGSTGGGKSWTVARMIEECARLRGKVLLLDATGEYRDFPADIVRHVHLGDPVAKAAGSTQVRVPPTDFTESDFIALFEPSGKVQGPKLREAMKSLRIQMLEGRPSLLYKKKGTSKREFHDLLIKHGDNAFDPRQPFNLKLLSRQIEEECVMPSDRERPGLWGGDASNDLSYCLSLIARINAAVMSPALAPVFSDTRSVPALSECLDDLQRAESGVLRVCLSGLSYEYRAREFIVNAVGRVLLERARAEGFLARPLLVFLDEAHNFLGRTAGSEDYATKLDAFELIAREGRKYGLNLCLATQRPRDLSEGVLSQIGTLVVHRTTHDRDREIVERSASEIDRNAAGFLASLRPGEAALLGVDFPVPITVQVSPPVTRPKSDGPAYQQAWGRVSNSLQVAIPGGPAAHFAGGEVALRAAENGAGDAPAATNT